MVFSGFTFLYYFLPVFILIYFAAPRRVRNGVLLVASLVFYYYGERRYVLLLLFSSVFDYIISLIIEKFRGKNISKIALIISITVNLVILCYFKYSDFFISNINSVLHTKIPLLHIKLPLGISFYTFQTMSYTIDVYRGQAKPKKNPVDFAAYMTMFPQLVAGPIVRYQTIAAQLENRLHTWAGFSAGVMRFVIGLGKKVIVADTLAQLNETALTCENQSVLFYWLAIISFMLQVYFDFSGYSDMAIGLGKILGFDFLENFNYPFIAKSISEFWQRWHISMGTWFREYIYIPLGGNRVSMLKRVRNIAAVWLVTGLWHGAAWNFILWGGFFAIVLALEKIFFMKHLERLPAVVRRIYVILILIFSFVIFHIESFSGIVAHFKGMCGLGGISLVNAESLYYLKSYAFVLVISATGATPILRNAVKKAKIHPFSSALVDVFTPIFMLAVLLIVTAYMVDSSFSPFLYFRF